ncbi:MAG TPA: FAD-dependent oxidoreductase [Vicinamibacterales bacterium]|nr:FAD-dependent oxidoreductase [Vicinamibacterales bacterium]
MRTATIVGAGVFGSWIAHALTRRGWRVTLIDQHGPASSRSSSGGETRIIRSGYGDLARYARWARDSLPEWLELENQAHERLFVRTGALFVGRNASWLSDTAATLQAEEIPCEWLDADGLARRYPQLDFSDAAGAVFEPYAGVLFARRAVQALVRTLIDDGVTFRQEHVDGAALIHQNAADALIFACGAWLPSVFPEVLRDVIFPTRQEVFFFGVAPGDARFTASRFPAWVAFDEGVYGLPDLEHRGVKVAIDAHGPAADPETMERIVEAAAIARIREILRRRLPALADAPLLESRVCQYENTANGHFLLDRLPGHDRVWIAGGGSGHGFKHGPMVGRYLAGVIEEQVETETVFKLAGRPPRQRAVH